MTGQNSKSLVGARIRKNKEVKGISPFSATRRSHKTEAAEDYTELIAELISEQGEARLVQIARRLGISHVTALRTMRRLEDEGFIKTNPYSPIELTPKGRELALASKRRHQVVLDLLLAIGVPKAQAEIDAEGMEHHISEETLKIIQKFIKVYR